MDGCLYVCVFHYVCWEHGHWCGCECEWIWIEYEYVISCELDIDWTCGHRGYMKGIMGLCICVIKREIKKWNVYVKWWMLCLMCVNECMGIEWEMDAYVCMIYVMA